MLSHHYAFMAHLHAAVMQQPVVRNTARHLLGSPVQDTGSLSPTQQMYLGMHHSDFDVHRVEMVLFTSLSRHVRITDFGC